MRQLHAIPQFRMHQLWCAIASLSNEKTKADYTVNRTYKYGGCL
ncbi:MAG: hypothetical protein SAL70_32740 [Scytonema sp. PMC 1070.18]|nr:hypothetical protein [Scytonema sp. PMC 1070.18]